MLAEHPDTELNTEAMRQRCAEIITADHDTLNDVDCATATLDDILEKVSVSSEYYHRALSMNVQGRSLILKRRPCDVNINNYNETILSAWHGNMDIQPVLDVYACIMYIVSYITKDKHEMSQILRAAKKEHADKDIRSQTKKIGAAFLTHREVSAQEAIFCLLGLPMLSCTVKCVFVRTDMPDNRVHILKASSDLQALHPHSEDIYMTGLVQRYAARPASLDSICLADFAVDYDVCYRNGQRQHDDDNADILPSRPDDDDNILRLGLQLSATLLM